MPDAREKKSPLATTEREHEKVPQDCSASADCRENGSLDRATDGGESFRLEGGDSRSENTMLESRSLARAETGLYSCLENGASQAREGRRGGENH